MGAWAPSSAGETDPPAKYGKDPPARRRGPFPTGLEPTCSKAEPTRNLISSREPAPGPCRAECTARFWKQEHRPLGDRSPVSIGISPATRVAGQAERCSADLDNA